MENELFEKTPPGKLFFKAALPGSVSMLASSLYVLFDGIFVGKVLGETAMAAVNLAFPFVVINFALSDLIAVGSSVPVSISLGQKNEKEANNIFTCSLLMILITGILMGVVMYTAAPWMIGLMGAQGELLDCSVKYIRVYAVFSPFTTVVFAMDNFWRISGKIRGSMILNVCMSVLIVVLDAIFLFVFKWGVEATALAACASMFLAAVIAFYPFLRGKFLLKFAKPKFSIKMVGTVISNGIAVFLSNIAGRLTAIAMNRALMVADGETAVSAYGVLMYVGDMINPVIYGLCDSLQPAVGYNWGAGNYKRVKSLEKYCFAAAGVVSIVGMAAMLLFPQVFVAMYVKAEDIALAEMALAALPLFAITFLGRWISVATQIFFTALAKPMYASVLAILSTCVVPLVLITALWDFGLNGLWLNSSINSIIMAFASIAFLAVLMRKFPKEKEII